MISILNHSLKFSALKDYYLHWIFLSQISLSFISPLKIVEVVKIEFVTSVVAKSLLTSLALYYLLRKRIEGWSYVLQFLCRPYSSFVKNSFVDSENLSRGEGGNIELGARTSKQISRVCDCFLPCSYSISICCTFIFSFIGLTIHLLHHSYLSIFFFQSRRQLSILTLI